MKYLYFLLFLIMWSSCSKEASNPTITYTGISVLKIEDKFDATLPPTITYDTLETNLFYQRTNDSILVTYNTREYMLYYPTSLINTAVSGGVPGSENVFRPYFQLIGNDSIYFVESYVTSNSDGSKYWWSQDVFTGLKE